MRDKLELGAGIVVLLAILPLLGYAVYECGSVRPARVRIASMRTERR